jgi:tetratricopeptide (TPR) repeat protein
MMDSIQIKQFNRLYDRGTSLIRKYAMIEGNSAKVGWFGKWRIKKGIKQLEDALSIHPDSWQSNFFIGKGWQALARPSQAVQYFQEAARLAPEDHNPWRELSYEAMVDGQGDLAESYARSAVAIAPSNDALHCNLALALIINSKVDEALLSIQTAVSLNNHPVNLNTLKIIQRVVNREIKPFGSIKRDGNISIQPI